MRKKLANKLKQNRAFTLIEMLVVVAVMVILLAISIIGMNEFITSMKMIELDNYAKTIYLEAQNQLIAEKVEGGMPIMAKRFEEERVQNRLVVVPQDYAYDVFNEEWKNLYYIGKQDALSKELIPETSYIYSEIGDYIIEFNPQTGMVYGVFYWEKENAINYKEDVEKLVDRTREERTDARLGYYGGASSDVLEGAFILNQQVELVNSEELYAKISYEATARLLAYYNSSLTIEYRIADQHGNEWVGTIDSKEMYNPTDGVDVVVEGPRLVFYVLLDSMMDGYGLEDLTGGTLVLDDQLSVTITSIYDHGSDYCLESNAEAPLKTNGLFANNSTKTFAEDKVEQALVQVDKVRHLRNLDKLNGNTDIKIEIIDHIDFESTEYAWKFTRDGEGRIADVSHVKSTTRPMDAFVPIKNDAVFVNGSGKVEIDGLGSGLKNFVIKGSRDYVGLFAQLKDVKVSNVVIKDIKVDAGGSDYVGALAGAVTGGEILNSGVYLTSFSGKNENEIHYSQMDGGSYSNEMERRRAHYVISGANRVGGLAGSIRETEVNGCYTAIDVKATGSYVGGFAGLIEGDSALSHSVTSSYSSGDVTGSSRVGGFAGTIINMNVGQSGDFSGKTGVYSTSDVKADSIMGGFVGSTQNTKYKDCVAYGTILLKNGVNDVEGVSGGGFLGSNAGGNHFDSSCSYLKQTDYNNKVLSNQIAAKGYNDYKADTSNDVGKSYPYDVNLFNTSFPFISQWDEQPHHYGDWPSQYVINTSLVYYEKYGDGNYGFYCKTYIAGSESQWLLNTLRDESCVEDGYAILSKFNLESIEYQLEIGSVNRDEVEKSNDATLKALLMEGTLEGDTLYPLTQRCEVEFNACDNEENVYTDAERKNTFKVPGMYLYRLPYELQCTARKGVNNFYDRVTLKNGVIYDADPYATEDIVVIDSLTFFYCPHFAKTAVNPNLSTQEDLSDDMLKNPPRVFVRSARQLNALGRYSYYWNNREGYEENLSFFQETDINFSTYTKEYCGQTFNLLAFEQPYSNRPIGEWDGNNSGKGAFTNDYDGNHKKIIDYCVLSHNQYVGLFGEVYKNQGATASQIKNIIMTVSPETVALALDYSDYVKGTPAEKQNNAGLIVGTFLDYSGKSGDDRARTGVGALVGSDYTIGQTEGEAKVFTIDNCAVAGYQVSYELNEQKNRDPEMVSKYNHEPQRPIGIAIGGLVGFSRGNISGSSVVNEVELITAQEITGNTAAILIGGFAGSLYHGTTMNCYSGGTINVDNGTGNYGVKDFEEGRHYVGRLRIGGFCPGWMQTYGVVDVDNREIVRYQDIYTYTDLDDNVWTIREVEATSSEFNHFIPVVGSMKLVYERRMTGFLKWETKWHTDYERSDTQVTISGMSYTLTEIYKKAESENCSDAFRYYTRDDSMYATYDNLSNLDWVLDKKNTPGVNEEGKGEAEYSYATSAYLTSSAYPFPAVVTNADGKYVHYGDWPAKQEDVTYNFPAYYEKYSDGTIGYTLLREGGFVENYLVTSKDTKKLDVLPGDSKTIVETGYGKLTMDSSVKKNCIFKTTIENIAYMWVDEAYKKEIGGLYYYYFVTDDGFNKTENDKAVTYENFAFDKVTAQDGQVVSEIKEVNKTIYYNSQFAAALSCKDDLGSEGNPLQVRTETQLSAVNNMNEPEVYMKMTHSIMLSEGFASINVKTNQTLDGGNPDGSLKGFAIQGATKAIFKENTGTIQNLVVKGSAISTDSNTAVFAITNNGTIVNSKVMDSTLKTSGIAAGFVYKNAGTIEKSGVHATSSYKDAVIEGNKAYGFVVENTGSITHGYVAGTVKGSVAAAGFASQNTGMISLSYANTETNATASEAKAAGFVIESTGAILNSYASGGVTGVDSYGFMEKGNAENCYTISEVNGTNKIPFAGAESDTTGCLWAYDVKSGYNMGLVPDVENPPEGSISLRSLMRDKEDYEFADAEAKPYDSILGKEYPYPMVGIAHFGDWMPPTVEVHDTNTDDDWRIKLLNDNKTYAGIFYYERYMDGSYGYYMKAIAKDTALRQVNIYSLADEKEIVVSSGYGVFYQDTRWDIYFDEDFKNDITDFEENELEGLSIPGVDSAYKYHYLNKDGIKSSFTRSLYYNLININVITIRESEISEIKK